MLERGYQLLTSSTKNAERFEGEILIRILEAKKKGFRESFLTVIWMFLTIIRSIM